MLSGLMARVKLFRPLPLFLLAPVLFSPCAKAVVIAYEPFAYPVSSNLSSNAGGSGWVGTWIYSPLISNHGTIIATNLVYGKLAYAGHGLRTAAPNGIDNRDFRKLDTTKAAVQPWIDAAGQVCPSGKTLLTSFPGRHC